jgi:hypothetical protein
VYMIALRRTTLLLKTAAAIVDARLDLRVPARER